VPPPPGSQGCERCLQSPSCHAYVQQVEFKVEPSSNRTARNGQRGTIERVSSRSCEMSPLADKVILAFTSKLENAGICIMIMLLDLFESL